MTKHITRVRESMVLSSFTIRAELRRHPDPGQADLQIKHYGRRKLQPPAVGHRDCDTHSS